MRRYLASGADGVEVDVYVENGRPMIGHPPRRGRPRLLRARLARKLESLHLTPGLDPRRLGSLLGPGRILWLDLKDRGAPRILGALAASLPQGLELVVSTRYHDEAPGARAALPGALVMLSIESRPPKLRPLLEAAGADGVTIEASYIDEGLVGEAREMGARLAAWVVNEPGEMERLIRLGVDYLITDYPEVAVRLRGRLCGGVAP